MVSGQPRGDYVDNGRFHRFYCPSRTAIASSKRLMIALIMDRGLWRCAHGSSSVSLDARLPICKLRSLITFPWLRATFSVMNQFLEESDFLNLSDVFFNGIIHSA